MASTLVGGVPVADAADPGGALVTGYGHVQYGRVLFGAGSSAGVRQLIGWRDLPDADVADTPRPQAHGTYPGDVLGDSLTVTLVYQVTGTPEAKAQAVDAIEQHTPLDGVERMLAVDDDGLGGWFRMARVVARQVPQDRGYRHGPVECSVQFVCADPRRYRMTERTATINLPSATVDGLDYPLVYPLEYGTASSTATMASNDGGAYAPLVVAFTGPLTNPQLSSPDWRLGFDLTLATGEQLVVDTAEGTALLAGTADRMHTIRPTSDPLELCTIPPGGTTLTLTAASGTGTATVVHRDARL